jgi:single-strand DNA-binding protein
MSLNRIILVGRLTRDPELKYTPAGVPVTQMGIAVNRFTKNDQGKYDVDFFDVVAWRRTAEFASQYLTKGRLVSVDGRLQTRKWVAQDGSNRTSYEIVAENLEGLDRREDGEAISSGGQDMPSSDYAAPAPRPTAPARNTAPARASQPAPIDDDVDESDPFADE